MTGERVVTQPDGAEQQGLFLASALGQVDGGQVLVLLAAQADPARPDSCRLEATVVPERPLAGPLRLVLSWQGGRRTARVQASGRARFRRVPAAALQSLRARAGEGALIRVERMVSESDALA